MRAAGGGIGLRYGVGLAFDCIVGGKLLDLVEAAAGNAGFARALPRFVTERRGERCGGAEACPPVPGSATAGTAPAVGPYTMSAAMLSAIRAAASCTESRARCA